MTETTLISMSCSEGVHEVCSGTIWIPRLNWMPPCDCECHSEPRARIQIECPPVEEFTIRAFSRQYPCGHIAGASSWGALPSECPHCGGS